MRILSSSHLLFFKNSVVKRNCVQSSYTDRYDKMLWRQIVNNNNHIGSYKTQLCVQSSYTHARMRARTHTRLTALFPGLPRWASTRKVKRILILLKQETVSGSGISWAICKSTSRSRQITTLAPHQSAFLRAGCPSCRPTNSIKALKAKSAEGEQ